jgi:hypothetical protein
MSFVNVLFATLRTSRILHAALRQLIEQVSRSVGLSFQYPHQVAVLHRSRTEAIARRMDKEKKGLTKQSPLQKGGLATGPP